MPLTVVLILFCRTSYQTPFHTDIESYLKKKKTKLYEHHTFRKRKKEKEFLLGSSVGHLYKIIALKKFLVWDCKSLTFLFQRVHVVII